MTAAPPSNRPPSNRSPAVGSDDEGEIPVASPQHDHGAYRAQLHVPDGRGGRVWVTVIEGAKAAEWVAMQQRNDGLIPMLVWPDPHSKALRICQNPGGHHHCRLLGPDGAVLSPLQAR